MQLIDGCSFELCSATRPVVSSDIVIKLQLHDSIKMALPWDSTITITVCWEHKYCIGGRTKCHRTKCHGKNVADKMLCGQNVIGQNVTDKMSRTKCSGHIVVDKMSWTNCHGHKVVDNMSWTKWHGQNVVVKMFWSILWILWTNSSEHILGGEWEGRTWLNRTVRCCDLIYTMTRPGMSGMDKCCGGAVNAYECIVTTLGQVNPCFQADTNNTNLNEDGQTVPASTTTVVVQCTCV